MNNPTRHSGLDPESRKINLIFFGTEYESALVLEKLINADFEISAVITKPDSPRGRGQKIDSPMVKKIAIEHDITVLQPQELSVNNIPAADIGILVSYGKIIPQGIIDLFPHGIINIHPSLLPKYRGPSPIETAISNGDNETGVSLMKLSAKMDAGPIYLQEKVSVNNETDSPKLYNQLFNLGADLLIENIDKIVSGELKPVEQNESEATYTKLLSKSDGILNPNEMTASECERKVRAYLDFPRTRINFLNREVIVTKAKVLENYAGDDWSDIIKCADDTHLQITELINPKSGKTMKTAEYLRGLPQR